MNVKRCLYDIHPDARIISVEVDEHEHRDTCKCEICLNRLVPWNDRICDGNGTIMATVAQIKILAEGYDPDGELLSDGPEWPVICADCIREALEIWRADVAARPVTNATVSARSAQLRAIDEAFDSLARCA